MTGWERDKRWSDAYLPEVKQILGLYLIGEPPREEDLCRNTDLIVLKMDAVRIGCRIRRPGFFDDYGEEFTIRSSRPSETKTELAKVIEGWGQYFFYGHAKDDNILLAWALCDLNVFRLWFNREILRLGRVPGKQRFNGDGSSNFIAFRFDSLPQDFVVARTVPTDTIPF